MDSSTGKRGKLDRFECFEFEPVAVLYHLPELYICTRSHTPVIDSTDTPREMHPEYPSRNVLRLSETSASSSLLLFSPCVRKRLPQSQNCPSSQRPPAVLLLHPSSSPRRRSRCLGVALPDRGTEFSCPLPPCCLSLSERVPGALPLWA